MFKFLSVIIICATAFPLISFGMDFSSTNFTVKDPVITPGSGFATTSNFQLWSSLGQAAIGLNTTISFGLKGGFLYFPAPTTETPPGGETGGTSVIVPPGGGGAQPISTGTAVRPPIKGLICDFTDDGRCNIFDLSILLYYMTKPIMPGSRYDLNRDGVIDLLDISILFYYWS